MKANVMFSLLSKALSIELVAENKEDRDFLALTKENMRKREFAGEILTSVEVNKDVERVTFVLNVPEEKELPMSEEEVGNSAEIKKSCLH